MKSLMKLSYIAAVFLIVGCASTKDTTQMVAIDPETEAIKQTVKLESELNLTSEQFEKVKEINYNYITENQKIRENSSQDKSLLQSIMKKNKEEKDLKMSQVLSESQYKKYLSLEGGKVGRKRDGSRGEGSGGRGGRGGRG